VVDVGRRESRPAGARARDPRVTARWRSRCGSAAGHVAAHASAANSHLIHHFLL